jgi:Cft2 family RNA processing exonuclease
MECYFGSIALPEENTLGKTAVVLFNIPELGICFKAPFDGVDADHCDLASLLALLEFIDSNQKYFSKHTYQIYGNNRRIINQVNELETPPALFSELMERTRKYREKYRYSLEWVPTRDNSAFYGVLD